MYEVMTWAVGKAEDLLSFLSRLHVKAARTRLKSLRLYASRLETSIDNQATEYNKVQNEIDRIKYFLDQEYKEL